MTPRVRARLSALGIPFALGVACADFTTGSPKVTSTSQGTIYQEQAVHWSRKPRVAVIEFDDKSGAGTEVRVTGRGRVHTSNPIGWGMKEQLVTALTQTGAFIVLERQALQDIMSEQDLGQTGRFRRETAAQIGELEGAELLIYGAVTEYHPSQASLDAGGGSDPLFGVTRARSVPGAVSVLAERAVAGFFDQDHVAIDIRLVDANTGRIVNATSVQATPKDFGGEAAGIFGTTLLTGGGQYSTPIQKTVRACMMKAVNFIAENAMQQGLLQRGPSPAAPPPASFPAASQGGGSQVVRRAQEQLNALGFRCGAPDGQVGPSTRSCLETFQRDEGLPVTGRLDAATRERLSELGR